MRGLRIDFLADSNPRGSRDTKVENHCTFVVVAVVVDDDVRVKDLTKYAARDKMRNGADLNCDSLLNDL